MSSNKYLYNDVENLVEDAMEGLLLSDPSLARIDGVRNVIVRRDVELIKMNYVTLISGGGSGHEPSHSGFLGHGMLTAAVLGNVFASPSVEQVLAAIRVCAGPHGCLLIVKNYTGDRLNFGMAMEKARGEGLLVEMIIVADDAALEGKGITGKRGVAGTCLVHKVAGACAASGASLAVVLKEAKVCAASVNTLGVALTSCTVPGTPSLDRLKDDDIYEVGLGIHGEPGREQRKLTKHMATVTAETLVSEILLRIPKHEMSQCVVLLNNLGSLLALELLVVTKCVFHELSRRNITPVRAYVGTFMTALTMKGISLSILPIYDNEDSSNILTRLDMHTSAPAWRNMERLCVEKGVVLTSSVPYHQNQKAIGVPTGGPVISEIVRTMVIAICNQLIEIEPELTRFDAICGDGDCGLVMKKGAQCVLSNIVSFSSDSATFCDSLASCISASMGGTSGALLELFFRAAANNLALSSTKENGFLCGVEALSAGVAAMKFYGGADIGMRTMLDALVPGIEHLQMGVKTALDAAVLFQSKNINDTNEGASVQSVVLNNKAISALLVLAAAKAREGCNATKSMDAMAGRSNYINAKLMQGVPDPGAFAVAAAFEIVADVALKEQMLSINSE